MTTLSINDAIADSSVSNISTDFESTFDPLMERARRIETREILTQGVGDEEPAAAALALLADTSIPTSEIQAAAVGVISKRSPQLRTWVPLYLTNYCDAGCKMCGMRRNNASMVRQFSGKKAIEDQLRILYEEESVRAGLFLTGEYQDSYTRLANAFLVGWTMRTALDMGFEHVHFNIGSMTPNEVEVIGEWVGRDEPVTMALFQETYLRETYARFMGADPQESPKADYDRRVKTFDVWLDAGFRNINPGALIGLHRNVPEEIAALITHVSRLAKRGANVNISMPRLRPAQGSKNASGVDDDSYLRIMAIVALVCPDHRVVLTTREDKEFQARAIDLCGAFSPGSPDVAPYRRGAEPTNDEESSQFLIPDHRRPGEILEELAMQGRTLGQFAGVRSSGANAA